MGIFSVLEERQSPGPLDDFWYEPIGRWRDGEDISPETALTATPVWAAVNVIAGTIGSMPLIVYRELDDGGKERARDLPLYDLLRWAPNRFQTAVEFCEMGQGHLLLRGNAFFRLETSRADELIGIVPLHPDKMKLKLVDGRVEYHYAEKSGDRRAFSSEEILHVKGLSSDGLIGYSPITVGAGAIALSQAAEHYGSRFFSNSATPSGILSHPGKLKPEARSNIKKSWQSAHGSGKQHSVALLEEGLSWTALSVSPEEAQFLETRKFQAEEVSRLFNVPPHLLMLLDRSTFSNVVEQNKAFGINCIRPWAIRWEQAIRKSIIERFYADEGLFTEFSMDALMRPDKMVRAQANQIALQNGALSIDEWRASENMNPLDNRAGEVHWMPLNIAPVSVAEAGPDEENQRKAIRDELRGLDFVADDDLNLRELRSLANRRKIADATKPLIEDVAQRLLRREVKAVRRMMKKELAGITTGRELRGTDSLFTALEEFYDGDFRDVIRDALLPVMRSYGREIYTQAAIEVGFPPEFTPELEEFVRGYVDVVVIQHASMSRQALQSIISATHFTELLNALELKLEEWLDKRAKKMAVRQTTEGNGAFSKFAYVAGGVAKLRWVTSGSATCPFCRKLNGRVVASFENFVNAGQALENEDQKLVPRGNIGHPPVHPGCDCFILPSI